MDGRNGVLLSLWIIETICHSQSTRCQATGLEVKVPSYHFSIFAWYKFYDKHLKEKGWVVLFWPPGFIALCNFVSDVFVLKGSKSIITVFLSQVVSFIMIE